MSKQITQVLGTFLKALDAAHYSLSADAHLALAELRREFYALSSAAPSAAEPVAFDLTQARAIVVDAIRRMRAAHVDCHDLTMLAEDFLHSTHAAAKTDELWDKTLQDLDNYHEWADQLASRIATITGSDIGEHSSANNPWSNAIKAAEYYLAAPPAPQAASEPVATQAARDVLAERQRQISAEGWTPEHDEGEMAMAAAGYAVKASDQIQCVAHGFDESTLDDDVTAPQPGLDPWPHAWGFKPCPPRRALVKAGALILAEIERLDRAAPTPSKGEA